VLEAFEGGEPSRIVFLVPDQKSARGPAKSGQQNGAHAKALHLEASTHAAFLSQSNLGENKPRLGEICFALVLRRKSSVIVLGGEPAVARRHRFPGPKTQIKKGQKSGEKASRGAPQTMPQMAWLFSPTHVDGLRNESFSIKRRGKRIGTISKEIFRLEKWPHGPRELPRMDHHDERLELKSRTQLTARAAMIKRGTAAQGVPVRQKRVAELDDDVAVLSSGKLEETKRDWRPKSRQRFRSENHAGRGLSSVWQIEKILAREKTFRTCSERNAHVFSGHGGEAGDAEKISKAREHI